MQAFITGGAAQLWSETVDKPSRAERRRRRPRSTDPGPAKVSLAGRSPVRLLSLSRKTIPGGSAAKVIRGRATDGSWAAAGRGGSAVDGSMAGRPGHPAAAGSRSGSSGLPARSWCRKFESLYYSRRWAAAAVSRRCSVSPCAIWFAVGGSKTTLTQRRPTAPQCRPATAPLNRRMSD